ncbi:hypothetical protein SETIT_1G163400v2 [Setaria italica]|uniref:Endonuclease/exonuclease/phosphatase domain-containing protein n=1 Tax=Setaria italica TaxID=4555 RepID=A0A368PKY3_SETIT|nr:hypothetical protein SETIT_1G163400v2 [Setaria italica]
MNASSVSYSLLSWNVRGLGEKDKCMIVRDTLTIARANIVCLQETKLRATDKLKSCAFLPMTLNEFRCVDSADTHASNYIFAVTNVYASADHRDSLPFLEDLEEIAGQIHGSWVLAGDFNLTHETLLRRDCQDRLALALHKRAAYWKQRGKHHAIREGYVNMRFFLAQATQRLHRNNIRALEMDGIVVSSHHDKTAALRSHLQSLLGANTVAPGSIDVAALYAVSTKVDTAPLIAPFTEPEACVAVRSMNL